MHPIVSPEEMKRIEAESGQSLEQLISKAGQAIEKHALEMMGQTYLDQKVLVLAGKGNNGADGRIAAALLEERGVKTQVIPVDSNPSVLTDCDLVIDAAYGTGLNRGFAPPEINARVLAVDIPSGLNGLTGEVLEGAIKADRTVSLGALKPGLLLGQGKHYSGEIFLEDLNLDASGASVWMLDSIAEAARMLPKRAFDSHKWKSACWVVGGSYGMTGAPRLAAESAYRSGAGYVRLSIPGVRDLPEYPVDAVGFYLPKRGLGKEVCFSADKFKSVVLGPGFKDVDSRDMEFLLSSLDIPLVVDGGALKILSQIPRSLLAERKASLVLTPHFGEFSQLVNVEKGDDLIQKVMGAAKDYNAVVMLKGPTTLIGSPNGKAVLTSTGDSRLAVAGTGDVLVGITGAFLAQGMPPLQAASLAAWVHGYAAKLGSKRGFRAIDLPDLLSPAFEEMENQTKRKPHKNK